MSHFADALRLLTGRAPQNPDAALSPRAILAIFIGLGLLDAATQRAMAGREAQFSLYGVNALIAWLAINLGVIVLFTRREACGPLLRQLVLLWAAASALLFAVTGATTGLASLGFTNIALGVALVGMLVSIIGVILGGRRIFKIAGSRRSIWKSVGFTACLWIALAALPNWPLFLGSDFSRNWANIWEVIAFADRKEPSEAQKAEWDKERRDFLARVSGVEAAQPYLLDAALARVTPRKPKKPNLFVIGVAGWSEQSVFLKETEASLDIVRKRLHAEGKTVSLVNSKSTATDYPIADIHNLAHVLRGVASKMNLEEDVLLLTMTSHGSRDGFALQYDSLVERTLPPETLRALLDAAGVKNRIVIVSACHSGVFVPALSDPRTMVITAARAERSSFGCADNRDWTYFGDAFFSHGMNETPSLTEAFVKARALVAQWEKEQKSEPSDPQIFVGDELRRRFPALVGPVEALAETTPLRETRTEVPAAGAKRL